MPGPTKPPKPRAERVYAPPSEVLLTEEDLRAWLADIIPALEAAGCSHPTAHRGLDPDRAVLREVRPADHTVSGWPDDAADGSPAVLLWSVVRPPQLELHLRVAAPAWVQARTLDLRLTGDGACGLTQKAIAALVADARERGILRWRKSDDGPGLSMWKARISLHGEGGKVVQCVRLA